MTAKKRFLNRRLKWEVFGQGAAALLNCSTDALSDLKICSDCSLLALRGGLVNYASSQNRASRTQEGQRGQTVPSLTFDARHFNLPRRV